MAIKNKKAATPVNGSKNKPVAKKAAVAVKKAAPSKSKPITKKAPSKPVAKKNVVTKPAAKKVAPAKAKSAPAKKAAPKPAPAKPQSKKPQAKKNVSAPKSDPKKKSATNHNQQTVNKKTSKPAEKATKPTSGTKPAPAKKAEPAKKAVAVKKAAPPAKKAAPVAKKTVAAKPAPAAKSAPKAAPAPAKKAAPAPVKAAPAPAKKVAPAPVAKPVAKPAAKPVAKKSIPAKVLPAKPLVATPKPTATPAARPIEKKPTVIIAHRKLENKSKMKETNVSSPLYQAETYRSILDEPELPQQSTVYRYSDEELAEFKQIIVTRLDAARKELHYLQGLITRKDEAGTEDTENRFMNMEDGSGAMEREQLAQLASRQIQFMNHLEKALVRIENKTYGVCRVTGKLIDKARLRAVPHATLSIEAKNMLSSKHN